MKFNNQYKLVVFGGRNEHDLYGTETLDCIEIFDEEIEEWKKTVHCGLLNGRFSALSYC